jgi:hypothetical protein
MVSKHSRESSRDVAEADEGELEFLGSRKVVRGVARNDGEFLVRLLGGSSYLIAGQS